MTVLSDVKYALVRRFGMGALTFDDYLKIANPSGKRHPSGSIRECEGNIYLHDDPEYKRLYRVQRNGFWFDLYEEKIDRASQSYVKKDADGEFLRDEAGSLVHYTQDELIERLGDKRYQYHHKAFDVDGNLAASTADEWGALLVRTNPSYKGMGLGKEVLKLTRAKDPFYDSGGYTSAGEHALMSVYVDAVRKMAVNGDYSRATHTGEMERGYARQILKQTYHDYLQGKKYPLLKMPKKDYSEDKNVKNSSKVMMTDAAASHVVVYRQGILNSTLEDIYADDSCLVKNTIVGAAQIGGDPGLSGTYYISSIIGERRVVGECLHFLLNRDALDGREGIRLSPDVLSVFDEYVRDPMVPVSYQAVQLDRNNTLVTITNPNLSLQQAASLLGKKEERERKLVDPYSEKYYLIQEEGLRLDGDVRSSKAPSALDKVLGYQKKKRNGEFSFQ
ncbi:hypothetical protein AB4254_08585 [Vibrio breoganii]